MSLPDGPKSPRIWQMLHWITMPFSFMQGCNDRYGDCFTAAIGQKLSPVVFFSNRRMRQLLMPPFHGERMRSYGQLILKITEEVMSQWVAGTPFTVRQSMQRLSMRVIL